MIAVLTVVVVLVVVALLLAGSSVRVLREYERGVVFRLGRLMDERGPGLIFLIPVIDRMVRVGLRTVVLNIPPQDIITRDNVPARVNAVTYFRIVDANRSVVEVQDYAQATSQLAQTTLRSILGKAELDTLLAERERLNADLQQVIDEQTEPWGIKVTSVEIKDVEIPGGMQRAIARQAEAERERRAKIINAEGEFQASAKLADAADVISVNPVTIQLRYLQTLLEMGGGDQRSTIVFPLPIDLLRPILERLGPGVATADGDAARRKHEQASQDATAIQERAPAIGGSVADRAARVLAPGDDPASEAPDSGPPSEASPTASTRDPAP